MTKVAWIKNPNVATGQDHLGVRAPSEFVYSQLIPGITNVTNRARYYTFYPWLIWAIEQHDGNLKSLPSFEIIRRADCLFTLIGIYHHHVLGRPPDALHDGLTGSRKLSAVINRFLEDGDPIRISKYATTSDTPDRYFMNRLGGLGQYYLGPLSDSWILKRNEVDQLVYAIDRGLPLAEAFDPGVDREVFFDVIERDAATLDDLDNLVSFCPCHLVDALAEREELASFLFSTKDLYASPETENRHHSLVLILDLIKRLQTTDYALPVGADGVFQFLGSVYRGALPDSSPWNLTHERLRRNSDSWKQYYANELMGIAVQTLFWAGISKLSEESVRLADGAAFGEWFADIFLGKTELSPDTAVSVAIDDSLADLPDITDWDDGKHEANLIWDILEHVSGRTEPEDLEKAVNVALKLLLALAARWATEPHDTFNVELPRGYEQSYPINLLSFIRHSAGNWKEMSVREWVTWLASMWGVETHLQIALRKLRYEALDTFKVIPSESGLRVVESNGAQTVTDTLRPGFTNPRVRQSVQMLLDTGAIQLNDGVLSITDFGEALMGAHIQ
ncbi:MAG: hypothetical protein AB7Q37_03380 [Pyrinomonadaceae bacterium]